MKQRLQFRDASDEAKVEPLMQSVPPLLGVEPISIVPPEREDCPTEEAPQANVAEKKEKVVRVLKGITFDQWALISGADFTCILGMKCSKLNPELCIFLMECFDPVASHLDFGDRGKIPVDVDSVVRVMAVPMGIHPVPYHSDIDATSSIFEMLGINDGKQPTIASIEKQLGLAFPADDAYLRKFIMYLVSSVLALTTGIHVSPKCYHALINIAAIPRYNWARFIIDILIQNSNAKEKKNWFKACMPYLMVLYVDALETDAVDVPEDEPHICAWTNKMIKAVVDLDTKSDGSFGNLAIIMWWTCSSNDMHQAIQMKRSAIINMCNVFEDGLYDFIRSLGNNQGKVCTRNNATDETGQQRNNPKRRRAAHFPQSYDEREVHEEDEEKQSNVVKLAQDDAEVLVSESKTKKRKYVHRGMGGARASKKKSNVTESMPNNQVHIDEDGTKKDIEDKSLEAEDAEDVTLDSHVRDTVITKPAEANTGNSSTVFEQAVVSPACTDGVAVSTLCNTTDALKNLQIYGPGSQSSAETTPRNDRPREQTNEGSKSSIKVPSMVSGKSKKSVTFADQGKDNVQGKSVDGSPSAEMIASRDNVTLQENTPVIVGGNPGAGLAVIGSSIDLNRKLELEFGSAEAEAVKTDDGGATIEEPIIISSNEDSSDSLDKIYASIDMPITTPSTVKGKELQKEELSPNNPNSVTPVPQPKRVVKLGPKQKSPYKNFDKKPTVTRSDAKLYNKVCAYGGRSKHPLNDEKIIDYGNFYIYLRDLANSIKPEAWLSNSTCEIGLRVLSTEMAKQKKFIMPLRIASKLREGTCHLDRSLKNAFECTSTYRLDHKDFILFAVLQDLTPESKEMTGHYYLIVLNLKAGRFEVMDSMRRKGDKGLMAEARKVIGSIKHFWQTNYSDSKIDISRYKTAHIPTPMQKTTYDYGYFVLKFIEAWDGRRLLPFKPSDMPALRKLYLKKWMAREENLINWDELLFQN
ncbi:hypothetical protein ACQ4PT_013863 [Festuca glaucescens]